MAEETQAAETTTLLTTTTTTTIITTTTEDMDLEAAQESVPKPEAGDGDSQLKRAREDEENGDGSKKLKVEEDKSVEEQRHEKLDGGDEDEEEKSSDRVVTLGPKSFGSGVEMFEYFFKFLHFWSPNVNINKYEHMVLLDLLKKGHAEPEKKISGGVQSFQDFHPMFKSRCFFLVREDESVDDFSFRKCVDQILPLPENMKVKQEVNKGLGRGGRGGRGGGGRGYGRGGGGKRN